MNAIDQAKEHIWRGLAMTKLLKELGWAMQQQQHEQPSFTFTEMNAESFRYVVAILADELEQVISLIDQFEAKESTPTREQPLIIQLQPEKSKEKP